MQVNYTGESHYFGSSFSQKCHYSYTEFFENQFSVNKEKGKCPEKKCLLGPQVNGKI